MLKEIVIILNILTFWYGKATAESFVNFGQHIQLSPITFDTLKQKSKLSSNKVPAQNYTYLQTDSDTVLAMTNRVLVKVLNSDNHIRLYDQENVASGEILAQFPEFSILSLQLKQNNALPFARELLRYKNVLYAQPDFLQITQSSFRFSDTPHYSPSPAIWNNWKQALHFDEITTKGEGVKVAIIDDAFDLNHPALKKAKIHFSMDTESRSDVVLPIADSEKHGTMVAGLLMADWPEKNIHGVIPGADLIAISNKYNWTSSIVLSMYLSYIAGADVITCSWGIPMLMQPISDTVKAISRLGREGKGSAIVFAAGNQRVQVDQPDTLQSMTEVISVAGVNPEYRVITNYGNTVDIAAASLLPTIDPRDYNKVSYIGGSSSAAPVISAVIAMMYAIAPELTVKQVRILLRDSTQPLPIDGEKHHQFGVINAKQAVKQAEIWANQQKEQTEIRD